MWRGDEDGGINKDVKRSRKGPPFSGGLCGKDAAPRMAFYGGHKTTNSSISHCSLCCPPPSVHTDFHVFSSSHPFFALTRHFFFLSRSWKAADL